MAAKVRRRRAKSPVTSPYGPIPMAHVGFLESRHLQPEHLPSAKNESIVSLRLIDSSMETISNVQRLSSTIKRLTASNLRLKTVPEDLMCSLLHLTKLDLSNNMLVDTSFPDCMKKLDELVDLRLTNNKLTKVPVCIRKLKHLTRLNLSDNQIVSCNGLEKLRRLRILVLDNNKLTSLFKEISNLRRLEVLRCSRNNLREISRDIRQLKSLVDLDLSDNHLIILPADIFLLPKLDVFIASSNEVNKVPTFNIRPQNKNWVRHIDLSDNKMSKFPGHLLFMTFKLDVSNNKIRSLPYHTLKKLDVKTDQQLLIKDNPLCYPPSDISDSGLKSILSFFQESESDVKVYQGVKVLVLGHHRSGKSSFIQTMIDQQTRMSEDVQDTSAGIDVYEMTFDLEEAGQEGIPGKSLELSIWDFCGHPFYMYPHYSFFEHPSVTVLTFNMAEYSDATFMEQIGCWFDWMIAKTNKVVIVLVGTQSDKLNESQISKVSRDVKTRLAKHIDGQAEFIRNRIKAIEERSHISPTLSEQLKTYMRILQTKTTVQTDVVCTSAKMFLGFDKVSQAIQTLAGDRQLFPNVMRVIPAFWLDVRHYIEDRGNAMSFPVMTWETFEVEVTSRFGMKHLMKSIAQYLHETGQVLWFSKIQTLKGLVFIRPSWFFDVLTSILRHDFEDSTFTPDDHLRSLGLTSMKFERLKHEALSEGVLDRDLLRSLLAPLIPADNASLTTDMMRLLVEGFELGYFITKRQRTPVAQSMPNDAPEDLQKLTTILIPWLRKNSEPEEFTRFWSTLNHSRKLTCCFRFRLYLPPGLFEIMCVRAHSEKHKLRFIHQWGGGIHAVHVQEKVHVLVTYFQTDNRKCDETKMLTFEVRENLSDGGEQMTPVSTMWAILLPLLLDFEQLLERFSGTVVERLTECPLCRSTSFIGEWLTPKETQTLASRFCEACRQEVDTAFLAQPREQKRVIIKRKNSAPSVSTPSPSALPKLPVVPEEKNTDIMLSETLRENTS